MKTAPLWLVAPLLVLGGCRGILGIEELDLASDAGPEAGTDAADAADATAAASVDGGRDATTLDPRAQQCVQGQECPRCCHTTFNALKPLEGQAKPCICTPGRCQNACGDAGDFCGAGSTPTTPPGANCGPCIDDLYRGRTCIDQCSSANCKAEVDCIAACPRR